MIGKAECSRCEKVRTCLNYFFEKQPLCWRCIRKIQAKPKELNDVIKK